MPSPQPGRSRVGNVLRLAHAAPTPAEQIRLSACLPRFSLRGYEPLSPASPRQPLLSPSAYRKTPSLPPTPSSTSFSENGIYFGHRHEPGAGTQEGGILPNTLASIRKRTRLKSCTVFVLLLAAIVVVAAGIAWSTNLHVPSEQKVRLYASRIGNGLRLWTDSVESTEPAEPASPASIASHPAGPVEGVEDGTASELEDIQISTLPKLDPPSAADRSVKYLGYLPHSGFHNQRIELQSALMLGKMLNRTV